MASTTVVSSFGAFTVSLGSQIFSDFGVLGGFEMHPCEAPQRHGLIIP